MERKDGGERTDRGAEKLLFVLAILQISPGSRPRLAAEVMAPSRRANPVTPGYLFCLHCLYTAIAAQAPGADEREKLNCRFDNPHGTCCQQCHTRNNTYETVSGGGFTRVFCIRSISDLRANSWRISGRWLPG